VRTDSEQKTSSALVQFDAASVVPAGAHLRQSYPVARGADHDGADAECTQL
jgi:hypothetical protein